MKNVLESTGNRAYCIKERISELEDRKLELIQVEEEREISCKIKWSNSTRSIWHFRKGTVWVSHREKRGKREQRVYLKKIITELPKLGEETGYTSSWS